jgi:hypothetical protein
MTKLEELQSHIGYANRISPFKTALTHTHRRALLQPALISGEAVLGFTRKGLYLPFQMKEGDDPRARASVCESAL